MTDRAALEAAVLAHPDDDTPRLVFADWLDDHGEPERAELIRCQIQRKCECDFRRDPDFRTCPKCVRIHELMRWWCTQDLAPELGRAAHEQLHPVLNGVISVSPAVEYVFDRGFVHLAAGLLQAFWAGHNCRLCGGRGVLFRLGQPVGDVPCRCCGGSGTIVHPRLTALCRRQPVKRLQVVDLHVFPSGGNDTYYLGSLGQFPVHWWAKLDNHRQRIDVVNTLSDLLIDAARMVPKGGVTIFPD